MAKAQSPKIPMTPAIRVGRRWIHVNYSAMAKEFSVSHTTMMRYFSASTASPRKPRVELAERLAAYLGITMEQLMGAFGTGEMRKADGIRK